MISPKRRIFFNSLSSVLQTLVTGLVYFLLYKYLLKVLGAEKLGLWSLIIASTSIANLGNLGITGSVVKFVANYLAIGDEKGANEVIWISLMIVVCLMAIICISLYLLGNFFFSFFISPQFIDDALNILPFALLSLFFSSASGVFLSALDGMELIYYRAFIFISTSILFLVACYLLVPSFQLMGIVYAQLSQAVVVLIAAPFFLYKRLRNFSLFKVSFKRSTVSELFSYGLKFQTITIASLFFEPTTKFCLSIYGGLHTVAYFEIASRLITQIRSLIVSATQVIVPVIAKKDALDQYNIQVEYRKLYKPIIFITIIVFTFVILLTPFISYLLIGSNQAIFYYSILLLTVGWSFNIFATPAYFINLGLGRMRWNIYGHAILSILNLLAGIVLGRLWGGVGVIMAVSMALIISSVLLILNFIRINKISSRQLTGNDWKSILALVSILIVCILVFSINFNSANYLKITTALTILFSGVLALTIKNNLFIMSLVFEIRARIVEFKNDNKSL